MTQTTITWQNGHTEQFTGLNSFKTIPALVKHYKLLKQQYCLHSRTEGIKHTKCITCGLVLK